MAATWTRALVTGASSGIGAEMCRQLAAQGTDLVMVARSGDRMADLARGLRTAHGVQVEVLPADLTDRDQLDDVAARVGAAPDIDLVVNNAGFGGTREVVAADAARERGMVDIHVVATLRLSHAALRAMTPRGRGGLLNVASVAGFLPMPSGATYAASKAWIRHFTESLHEEQRGTGVHVTVLCPGFVRTPMLTGGREEPGPGVGGPLVMDASDVVRDGLAAVTADRAVVVPGMHYRAAAALLDTLPLRTVRALLRLRSTLGG